MLYRFSMGVSGIHRFLFLIRTTTSHLQKVIDDSEINENWLFDDFFPLLLLMLTNLGFSKFSQIVRSRRAIPVVYSQMSHPNWQPLAPSQSPPKSGAPDDWRASKDLICSARSSTELGCVELLCGPAAGAARSGYSPLCHLILTEKYEE